IGTLQQEGLAVGSLAWQLAPETAKTARQEAMRKALGALRARAEEAAGVLGLHFVSFKEVRLDVSAPAVPLHARMAPAAMAAAPPPPPSAESEAITVSATA